MLKRNWLNSKAKQGFHRFDKLTSFPKAASENVAKSVWKSLENNYLLQAERALLDIPLAMTLYKEGLISLEDRNTRIVSAVSVFPHSLG